MICGMAAATKDIPFLPSEKTDKKEMDGGCNESHSLLAVRKDTQTGNDVCHGGCKEAHSLFAVIN